MEITEVLIRKVNGSGKLKAYATITFDEVFVVHNVKIIDGDDGFFIVMPSRKTPKGDYKDVAHPIVRDFRNYLQERVIAEFRKTTAEMEPPEKESPEN